MHKFYTFEHHLSWFYTCVNRQGKEKSKKIRRKRATVAPYLLCARLGSHPRPGEQGKNPKKYGANAPQLHPIWPQAASGAHSPAPSSPSPSKMERRLGGEAR